MVASSEVTGKPMQEPQVDTDKPLVTVGWVLAADERDAQTLAVYERARTLLRDFLAAEFPGLHWEMPVAERRRFPPQGSLDPLPLLEMGVQEKLDRVWDFALVLVPNELTGREMSFTAGVPSSALEVAALSSSRLARNEGMAQGVARLALHLLGHLWGLEHAESGPMRLPRGGETAGLEPFPDEQQHSVQERLEEVADARLEEERRDWDWLSFHWQTVRSDPRGIVTDVLGYSPWRLPLRAGRLTAAAAVTLIFLLLGAESWEIGTNLPGWALTIAAVTCTLVATIFVYLGQNLSQVCRGASRREQLTRTRIVLFATLLIGMTSTWVVLFALSVLVIFAVPDGVTAGWLGGPPPASALYGHAAFVATLGILAAALGGNLEEQDVLKSSLLYDEET